MDEQKANRGRDEEARDPNRTGGLGSRRDEAPGQSKPEQPAENPDADTGEAGEDTVDEGEPSA